MKKISILALHLNYGGIERAIVSLANLACDKYKVEIVCTYKMKDEPAFKLNSKVNVKYLNNFIPNKEEFKKAIREKNIFDILKEGVKSIKILYLRKKTMIDYIKNIDSDIIISSRFLFNKILSKYAKSDVTTIGWEHNHFHGNYKIAKKTAKSVKKLDYFVLVSQELKKYYSYLLKNTNCKCIYIPNIIDEIPKNYSNLKEKRFISVGRLSKEKGYMDLLKIAKKLFDKYNDWHLDIIGDGEEKEKLINFVKNNNLTKNITFHGFQNRDYINNILSKSSIYLMTSYTESFGIVLLEAGSFGLPLVAYSSAEGAKEIITNGINGYLIDDRNEIKYIEVVEKLMNDYDLRKKLGNCSLESVKKYLGSNIINEWENIFK